MSILPSFQSMVMPESACPACKSVFESLDGFWAHLDEPTSNCSKNNRHRHRADNQENAVSQPKHGNHENVVSQPEHGNHENVVSQPELGNHENVISQPDPTNTIEGCVLCRNLAKLQEVIHSPMSISCGDCSENVTFTCERCKSIFRGSNAYERHVNSTTACDRAVKRGLKPKSSMKCETCAKDFKSTQALKGHSPKACSRNIRQLKSAFQCTKCSSKFLDAKGLGAHVKSATACLAKTRGQTRRG